MGILNKVPIVQGAKALTKSKGVKEFLFGTKGKHKSLPTLTEGQQGLMDLIIEGLTSGEGPLKDVFGKFNKQEFDEGVSQPALKQFQEKILPSIREPFSGNGTISSGRRRAEFGAATDLQDRLAQLMYQAQQTQKGNQIQGVNTALGTKAFENTYKPGTQGAVQSFLQGAGNFLGKAGGSYIAG
jgi:hypothetical protein